MNIVTIQPTIFENSPQGDKTFGYRMYDDYGQTYSNTWESMLTDDMEILQSVMDDGDDIAADMLSFLLENGKGLCIGNTWYDFEDIKHLWGLEDE
jgi:hypothetical protein